MYYLVGAVVLSLFLYWILQARDDARALQEGREQSSTPKRVMLFFFLLIVSTCICFLVDNAMRHNNNYEIEGGGDTQGERLQTNYKTSMIKNINEDVMTGLPPFSAAANE